MTYLDKNIDMFGGLFLISFAILILVIPPKFGNVFYGVTTKWTLKNEAIWASGQRLFAISIIIIGLLFFAIGIFQLHEDIPSFSMVILLIGLWGLSKYIVHKILEKKYPAD